MLLLVSGDNRLAAEKVGYVNGVAYAPIGCLLPAKRRPTPYAVKSWSVARPDAAFCCSLADGSYGLEGTYCTIIGFLDAMSSAHAFLLCAEGVRRLPSRLHGPQFTVLKLAAEHHP